MFSEIERPAEDRNMDVKQHRENVVEQLEKSFVIKERKQKEIVTVIKEDQMKQFTDKYQITDFDDVLDMQAGSLLFISQQAEHGIKKHIEWGIKTDRNVSEQGGILIGKPFLVGNIMVGIAEYVIPGDAKRADAVYLEMGTETWAKMLKTYDERYKNDGLYIIGWFHTHPNDLPVFMSPTDMKTQKDFFNEEWHFSLVLNPHRRLAACFNSAKAIKCDYYPHCFADREEDL